MSKVVRDDIALSFEGKVIRNRGIYGFAPEPLNILNRVSGLTSELLSNPDIINLPSTTERVKELSAFGSLLVTSLIESQGKIRFITPVCPDYSQELDENYYETIGEGISPQAKAAIRASRLIEEVFSKYGFEPKLEILVADTEDDIPEVMDRCVGNNAVLYQNRCSSSVMAIKQELSDLRHVEVSTFSIVLGDDFRQTQYRYEEKINELRLQNEDIDNEVCKIGGERKGRHSKILGREEVDFELTIRYMAQYAALGSIVRNYREPTVLLNYPTSNMPFFNAAVYRDKNFSLSGDDMRVVPVLVTRLGMGL